MNVTDKVHTDLLIFDFRDDAHNICATYFQNASHESELQIIVQSRKHVSS